MALLTVRNLTYQFSAQKPLFSDVFFAIDKPGITGVVGKNGVGKSTLFKLLQGGAKSTGIVMFATKQYDLSVAQNREALHMCVKLMHQKVDRMLAPSFTVQENLQAAGLNTYPGLTDFNALSYDTYGYTDIQLNKPVKELSGGQKQIVALLMALQKETSLLLLDEPTAALDEKNAQYFMDFVHTLACKRNIVVLCITHDPALVERFQSNGVLHLEHTEQSTYIRYE